MGIFEDVVSFNNQSYSKSLEFCKNNKCLFQDPTFPIDRVSLTQSGAFENLDEIEWKRPAEISKFPRLLLNDSSSILKGEISNPYLPVCITAIRKYDHFKKVIPNASGQEWNEKKPESYVGIYLFRFWNNGEWVEVIVDDFLPTRNGVLIGVRSANENEFWCSLIEKAYAKLSGSYEEIFNNSEEEILLALTGGVPETLLNSPLDSSNQKSHFEFLQSEQIAESILLATVKYDADETEGLVPASIYWITGVRNVNIKNSSLAVQLNKQSLWTVRLNDPSWTKSWTGMLSEKSHQWSLLSASDKSRMEFTFSNDGDFWMTFSDFMKYFDRLMVMHIPNLSAMSLRGRWYQSEGNEVWYGACESNERAVEGRGGGGQYYFDVTHSPRDNVLIHVSQKCQKSLESSTGLLVFQVERNRHTVLFSTKWAKLVHEYHIDKTRSIGIRCNLEAGGYVVKAYSKDTKTDQLFYHLRVLTSEPNNGRFLLNEPMRKIPMMCFCFEQESKVITRLRIVKVSGIRTSKIKSYQVFCQVCCEGNEFQTQIIKEGDEFVWEEPYLFYQMDPSSEISFKLYNKCLLFDDFFGLAKYHYDGKYLNKDPMLVKFPLQNNKGEVVPGTLEVAFWHTDSYVNL